MGHHQKVRSVQVLIGPYDPLGLTSREPPTKASTRSTGETGRFPTREPWRPNGRSIVICRSSVRRDFGAAHLGNPASSGACGVAGIPPQHLPEGAKVKLRIGLVQMRVTLGGVKPGASLATRPCLVTIYGRNNAAVHREKCYPGSERLEPGHRPECLRFGTSLLTPPCVQKPPIASLL